MSLLNYWSPSQTVSMLIVSDFTQIQLSNVAGSVDGISGAQLLNGAPVSAAFQINSTAGCFLNSRSTQAQIDDFIVYPGMQTYNTNIAAMQFYYGGAVDDWVTPISEIGSGTEFDIVVFGSSAGTIKDSGVMLILAGGIGDNDNIFEGVRSGNTAPGVLSVGNVVYGIDVLTAIADGSQNNTIIGSATANLATQINDVIAIGNSCLSSTVTGAQRIVSIGNFSLNALTDVGESIDIVAIGDHALFNSNACQESVAIGSDAGRFATSAGGCTFVGYRVAGASVGDLIDLTGIGAFALQAVETGAGRLTACGFSSLQSATTALRCSAYGYESLSRITDAAGGADSSAFGNQSMIVVTSALSSDGFGSQTFGSATTLLNSCAFGTQAGSIQTTYTGCCFFGQGADALQDNLSNASAFGQGALVNSNDSMVLGKSGTKIGIGVSAPNGQLHINAINTGGINGGIILPYRFSAAANFNLTYDDYIVMSSQPNVEVTLPVADTDHIGQTFIIKKGISNSGPGNQLSIIAQGSQQIDGSNLQTNGSGWASYRVFTDGFNWFTF